MSKNNIKKNIVKSVGLVSLAGTMIPTGVMAFEPGTEVTLTEDAGGHISAYDKKPVTTYRKGDYKVYKTHKPTNMVNVSKKTNSPGAWVERGLLEEGKGKKPSSSNTTSKPEEKESFTGYVSPRIGLNMRVRPSTNGNTPIAAIPYGTALKVTEHNSSWYKTEYKGKTGYVSASFITKNKIKVDKPVTNKTPNKSNNTQTSSNKSMPLPSGSYVVTSEYGYRIHPISGGRKLHSGIDLAASGGTRIFSVKPGQVVSSTYSSGYGNYVKVRHHDGTETLYAHMSSRNAYVGQQVKAGQVIGYVGTTGNSTGNHLHFELWKNGSRVNPRTEFNF